MKDFKEWVQDLPIEISIQIDVGDERAVDTTFSDLEDLEMSLHKLERWIEASKQDQYNQEVEYQEMIAEDKHESSR